MNITIYCASSGRSPECFVRDAAALGRLVAEGGHTLVNGAGRTGLMAAATDACLEAGGEAVGVIPQFMIDQGWQHRGMTRLVVTENMHIRKERMAELSDACIALPGGVGTLEELLEIITWKQLGLYMKPIIVLNTQNYFSPLLRQLEQAVEQQFMSSLHATLWQVAATPEEALRFAVETPPLREPIRKFAAL